MTAWDWINKEPGTLVLSGTPFSVVYAGYDPDFKFHVLENGNKRVGLVTLISAKHTAENLATELREIGVIA